MSRLLAGQHQTGERAPGRGVLGEGRTERLWQCQDPDGPGSASASVPPLVESGKWTHALKNHVKHQPFCRSRRAICHIQKNGFINTILRN